MDELSRTLSSLHRAITGEYEPRRHMNELEARFDGPIPADLKRRARQLDAEERAAREALNDPKADAARVQGIAEPIRE